MVTLVEQHVIKATDPRFAEIDAASFAAKNLYNRGNYTIRQSWLEAATSLIPNSTAYRRGILCAGTQGQPTGAQAARSEMAVLLCSPALLAGAPRSFSGAAAAAGVQTQAESRMLPTYNDQTFSRRVNDNLVMCGIGTLVIGNHPQLETAHQHRTGQQTEVRLDSACDAR